MGHGGRRGSRDDGVRLQHDPDLRRAGKRRCGADQSAAAAARRPHPQSGRDRQGLCEARAGGVQRGRRGPGQARRSGPEREPAADGRGERGAQCAAGPVAGDRRKLPAAQGERELPRAPGPARGHGEPHRRRAARLQRGREPLQRLHPAVPAAVDGEADRQGTTRVLRVAEPGRGDGAEGGLFEVNSPFRSTIPLLVLAAAVAACHDSSAPPPPLALPPGELAFVSDRRLGQKDIYLMGTDGTITNLTPTSFAYEGWPSWSPHGTQIAFESDRAQNGTVPQLDVYVMNADGSGTVQRLTTDTTNEFEPAWSPDSTKIAFATNRDGNDEIYVMHADGTNPVNLTNSLGTDLGPAWSPDGTKIAFYSNGDGDFAIFIMNADGTGVRQLTTSSPPDELPSWSPDGRYILFDSDADLYFVTADGSNGPQQLTRGGQTDIMARWRP